MKFSKILLDDYMQTKEGKRVKAFFEGLPDAFNSRYDTSGFFEFMRSIATIDYTEYYISLLVMNDLLIVPRGSMILMKNSRMLSE